MEGAAAEHRELNIEPEPAEWQPRATWMGVRGFTGGMAFFYISFLFAFFYLKSQDVNQDWKIGHVAPSVGIGAAILACVLITALALRMAVDQPRNVIRASFVALTLALLSVLLQVIQWATISFGPASGGYASVYVGWTIFYALGTLFCCYWIETQAATAWRRRRDAAARAAASDELIHEGVKACSFFWNFMTVVGFLMFVCLYAIG